MTLFDPPDPEPDPEATDPRRLRMVVAYDGEPFHGFAVNPGVRTVAGVLTDALARVLGHDVQITCAGRTDRGVHGNGQVVTFDVQADRLVDGTGASVDAEDGRGGRRRPRREDPVSLEGLARSINSMCGPTIAVSQLAVVPDDFDARFSALARRYRYQVLNRPEPDPFLARYAWHVPEPLSRSALELACDPFIGEHDFAAFCRRPKRRDGEQAPLVRRVIEASWVDAGDGLLWFEIEASSFCHQMVRAVVGTMVDVGRGRLHAGDVLDIIRSQDRSRAGDLAPPHGLCLRVVRYRGWSSG